ncbi:L-asparaginase 1 [Bacteroidia bacterium]|nr:L-asparaginase 1 [Bacteroidia bacterium]
MLDHNASVLLIYTGGTIGMVEDAEGALMPFDFNALQEFVPELKRFQFTIDTIQFENPVDSSDMNPDKWAKLVWIIEDNYAGYDGFVILHGTDTMAYSASALSFMLENLDKPVILTGSQLPIGKIRTDGKENLLTALEIAVEKTPEGTPLVTEVCIFFQNLLMRGNRTTKINADNFKAFNSFNFPVLAEAGTQIRYRHDLMHRPLRGSTPKFHYALDPKVAIVKIFPGMSAEVLKANSTIPHLKAIVLETYGAGDAPREQWFLDIVEEWIKQGIVVLNVTQCASGSVDMSRYQAGKRLQELGVLSGYDITTEAAVAKLMFLFGLGLTRGEIKIALKMSIVGEITV